MNRSDKKKQLVDRYLRNEMMADEEEDFEATLLDSSELQLQLETAMAISQVVQMTNEHALSDAEQPSPALDASINWQPVALAASVVLAVFSTTMYWKVSSDAGALRSEINYLSQPRTAVLTVPLDIMRSASSETPDVIIQKPAGNTLLVLDVELSPAVMALGEARMTLRDAQAAELLSWDSNRFESGRITAAFDTHNLPDGRVWLEMSDSQGQVVDRRLIEFLR